MDRNIANALLNEYVTSKSLRGHCIGVATCMEWYAKKNNLTATQIDDWWICGLLHDFDYEKYPTTTPPDGHPYKGCEILKNLSVSEEILNAIMGHALYTGVTRTTDMAKYLFAVDELSGLVTACVWVRPDKSINTLEVSSVKKKFKDKAFARGCNRDDINLGVKELGIDFDLHIQNIIDALKGSTEIFQF